MPYRCWVNGHDGRVRARFVPQKRNGSTQWGPIFSGRVYLQVVDGRRQTALTLENQRFFADELETWVP